MPQSIEHNSMTTNFPYSTNSHHHHHHQHSHLINGFYNNNNIHSSNIQGVRLDNGFSNSHMDIEDTEMDVTSDSSSRPLSHCQSACSYGSSSMEDHDDLNAKDDDMTFCMSNYAKEALKMMFMMRSHNMLTDVILEVKQELFPAHKVVLSAASPYFKAMFTGGLKETEMSRVQLQGVCPTAMGRIIYFMYTGHIRVTEVTVCQLLPAATMFQVPNVIDACCAFLERQLDPTNAIGIASFAEQHGCTELQKKANHFIERHFTQVCQEEEFLQLSAYQLIALIRRDELNVQGEREVYNAVLKWVKFDEENRYPKMEHILFSVRCQLLTPTFLREQMKNCDVLRKVPACREYLAKIFKDLTLHKRPVVKERKPNTTRMIFVAGGFFRQSLDILEAYNVDDKTWTTLRSLRIPRSGLGAAFLKGVFYAVGGRNNSIGSSYDSDWVDRYNALTEQWRPCAPMTVPRHRVGVAVMDELMYAVGGSAGSEYHNTVEYYDPELDRWFPVQPMHAKRLGVGVVVVNRLLYAVGGFNGTERLASVERYHPENNAWSFVPPMTCGRSGAGVAAINQYIYVVGGFDGTRQLSSVERFDTENQVWEHVAPIKIARSALSLTSLDGKLYAIGGFDGTNFLSIVEVYDPKTNTWEQGTPLSSGRSGHASAVIFQPSCVNNFMMDCVEDESSNRDGSGPGNNDSPSDENLSDQPGGSRTDGSLGGSSSFVGFQTSFGSSGCRNCENDLEPPSEGKDIVSSRENKSTDSLATSLPSRDIPHKKRRSRWSKKMCEIRNEEANATAETAISNIPSLPVPNIEESSPFPNACADIENSTNLININLNNNNNIKTNVHKKLRSRWSKKMCEIRNEEVNATAETAISNIPSLPVPNIEEPPSLPNACGDIENSTNLININLNNNNKNNNIKTNVNTSTLPSPNVKRKCHLTQFKSKCLFEVIRKCNARIVVQEYLNSLLEKHSKKFVTL